MNVRAMGFCAIGLLILLPGCASSERQVVTHFHQNLMFDAAPGTLPATEILHHSDWPGYPHNGPQFETVFFSERTVDIQDTRNPHNDRTYRRFDTVRVGRQYR